MSPSYDIDLLAKGLYRSTGHTETHSISLSHNSIVFINLLCCFTNWYSHCVY